MNITEIIAKRTCEIELIHNMDEDADMIDSEFDVIKKGEKISCDLISVTDDTYEVQFFDGTMAYLDMEDFELNTYFEK